MLIAESKPGSDCGFRNYSGMQEGATFCIHSAVHDFCIPQ